MANQGTTGGFRLPVKTAELQFSGDYEGAEVEVLLTLPMGKLWRIQELINNTDNGLEAFDEFGNDILIKWNIVDGEGNIPPDATGIRRIDPLFALLIMREWVKAVMNPPDPLFEPSENGKSDEEITIPMDALPKSLQK